MLTCFCIVVFISSIMIIILLQIQQQSSNFLLQKRINTLTMNASSVDLMLDITNAPSLFEYQILEEVRKIIPNVPIAFWDKLKNGIGQNNKTCGHFPRIFDLNINNMYWQTLKTSNGTFQLYGAYLDNRQPNVLVPTIRILGMIDRVAPTITTHCQIWFENNMKPVTVKTFEYTYIWYKGWGTFHQGVYQPYLITCILPKGYRWKIPISVSMVEKPCDNSSINLRVIYERPRTKKDFAVCVKGLDFLHEDISIRLVEWIELLGLLGVDKIFFYVLAVHPNISKVLKYYEQTGQVHVTPISLPGEQPNEPALRHVYLQEKLHRKRQNELIPYNDCFYKHMYEYDYIVLLDIDEIIIPLKHMSWRKLIDAVISKSLKINRKPRASYAVRNVYFFEGLNYLHGWVKDIPKYMHMLQHIYRSEQFTKPHYFVKCFFNTEIVKTVFNHFPFNCLEPCMSYAVSTDDAQLQHYRVDCVDEVISCQQFQGNIVIDTTIWKYEEALVKLVNKTLQNLEYFSNSTVTVG